MRARSTSRRQIDYPALGAGTIEVVATPNGYDTVRVLSGLLKDVDLVLAGGRAESGAGSGLFPYALAKALGRPVVANVLDVEIEGAEARVRQFLPKGRRRGVAVSLPAILAVHPLTQVRLGYAYACCLSGRDRRRLSGDRWAARRGRPRNRPGR